ncbi:peptide ABC transporter substrate-binding protein [Pseudarthrobacter psychrotolerans]|uniref:Peptide ABC transporter substrate-binding protein n=1 Tax=Pseudarthrobacter psychrotolerans TaxID=2697569 RepID=A0A6P1NNX4_9MICC|nr:ABC transporter substrate-binding protein [Pseudarthrobacter psychrotolerans]QHK18491.1 peptide ABC transporter substrate-binding protein [Pseudarthrobacter psychrotolerans]
MAGVAMATVAALSLTGCGATGNEPAGPKTGGTLTIGARQDLASFDPGAFDTGAQVQYWQPVYDTLLNYTPEGKVEPNLATEFKYNETNTVLTLKLREGVKFSDGTPFNADAVKANIEHLKKATGVSVYMVGKVKVVTVVDPTTVQIELSAPDPAFTYYLCLVAGAMGSPAALETEGIKTVPVGSGPYTLDTAATIRGSQYTYVRNPDYWNATAFPYDSVVVKPMEDLTARLNAIKSGQVNSAEVDSTVLSEARASNVKVNEHMIGWQGIMLFDREGTTVPALKDKRVRQALNYAIDGESINKNIYGGEGKATQQIFNPASPAFDEKLNAAYPYDLKKAKSLMADAGYAGGFELTMPTVPGDLTGPYITQQLAEIGVKVTWEKVPNEALVPDVLKGKFAAASFGSSSGHPWRDISKMISGTAAWNPFKTKTAELDGLLAKVQSSTGDEQIAAYKAVNNYITDNAWFCAWAYTKSIQLTDHGTQVAMQAGSGVPYLRNYSRA